MSVLKQNDEYAETKHAYAPSSCAEQVFFFCTPSYTSGVHHFGQDICVCDRISLIQPQR